MIDFLFGFSVGLTTATLTFPIALYIVLKWLGGGDDNQPPRVC